VKKLNINRISKSDTNEQVNCGKLAFWQDWFPELRKGLCEGRPIWVQSPKKRICIQHAKSVLGTLGFTDLETPYLSAKELVFCFRFGFLYQMTIRSRALLIGSVKELSEGEFDEFKKILQKSREFKRSYELNLVLIDERDERIEKMLDRADLEVIQPVLINGDEVELNEVVQDWVEEASTRFQKKVCRLSEEAAEFLEALSENEGLNSVKFHIFQGVANMCGSTLQRTHLEAGRKENRFSWADTGLKLEKNEIF
jgi:hypothetical protein